MGYWYVSADGRTLVFDQPQSGNYQVQLSDLCTCEDARIRIEEVVALKDAWVDQRVVDDLRRAIRDLTKLAVPPVWVSSANERIGRSNS